MIRRAILVLLFAAIAVAAAVAALAGEPGRASVEWMGWRVNMTAAAAVFTVLFGAFASLALWRLILWIVEAPARGRPGPARKPAAARAPTR